MADVILGGVCSLKFDDVEAVSTNTFDHIVLDRLMLEMY